MEKECYNRKKAEEWEEWAAQHYDECSECYRERKRAEKKAQGLVMRIRLCNPFEAARGRYQLVIVFDGDTYPYKDRLKARGAVWTDEYPTKEELMAGSTLAGLFMFREAPKKWVVYIEQFCELNEKLSELMTEFKNDGARIVEQPSDANIQLWTEAFRQMVESENNEEKAREIFEKSVGCSLEELQKQHQKEE